MSHFQKLGSLAAQFCTSLVKYGVVLHCTLEYVGDFVVCSGPSMEPNIRSHDILLTEHITPRLGNLKRGDIVIARSPTNPQQFVCKRVIALPGDHILQTDGSLKHVSKDYGYPYALSTGQSVSRLKQVPKGHVWIEGDNSPNSTDSRMYGPIPIGLVRGRALLRLWPLLDAKVLVPQSHKPDVKL